jgi:hypothetical protein
VIFQYAKEYAYLLISFDHIVPFLGVILHFIDKCLDRMGWLGRKYIPVVMGTDSRPFIQQFGRDSIKYKALHPYFDVERKFHLIIVSCFFSIFASAFYIADCKALMGKPGGAVLVTLVSFMLFFVFPVHQVFRRMNDRSISPQKVDTTVQVVHGDAPKVARWNMSIALTWIWNPSSLSFWSRYTMIQLLFIFACDVALHKYCKYAP